MTEIRDPIAFELFKNAIFAIADEMAVTITRDTYSGVLKDNMDFSTAFADAEGRLVAQGLTLPGHLGSIPPPWRRSCANTATTWRRAMSSIMNDPFDRRHASAGHLHLQAHLRRRPAHAFSASVCHHTDVGGRVAGSNASDSTEIYAEGLRIAPLKFYEAASPTRRS